MTVSIEIFALMSVIDQSWLPIQHLYVKEKDYRPDARIDANKPYS